MGLGRRSRASAIPSKRHASSSCSRASGARRRNGAGATSPKASSHRRRCPSVPPVRAAPGEWFNHEAHDESSHEVHEDPQGSCLSWPSCSSWRSPFVAFVADSPRQPVRARSWPVQAIRFRSSSTSPARRASPSSTPTAPAPTSTWSKRWDRAGCSSTTTTTAGSTSSSSTAGRSPTRPSRSRARHRLYPQPRQRHVRGRQRRSGIQHREYGMGACAGDYDGDGRAGPLHHQLRPQRALPQPRRRHVRRRDGARRGSAIRSGAPAARSPIWIATAISICGSPTTSTPTGRAARSAATRAPGRASTATR